MKHRIVLNSNDAKLSQGYQVLKRNIIESNVFDIKYDCLRLAPEKYWRKEEGLSTAIIDGTKVIIDANGDCCNLMAMYRDGLFDTIFKHTEVIIKTQYKPHPFYDDLRAQGIKVVSWIMWSTIRFPRECFQWQWKSNSLMYVASCAGGRNSNRRWGRPPYVEWCKKQSDFYTERQPVDQWAKTLQHCKWGLILQGGNKRNCDGKNTREVEFASCGMPMALNYIPHYEYEFNPNEHFLYLTKPEDLAKLRTVDPRPFAEKSKELWENYLRPEAAARYLLRLIYG